MLPAFRDGLTELLPDRTGCTFFAGRDAAWLLHRRLAGPAQIAKLRRGPEARLLARPGLSRGTAACGDWVLRPHNSLPLADLSHALAPRTGLRDHPPTAATFATLAEVDPQAFSVSFPSRGGG
ncbi:MAG: hypothetical protein AAGG06_04600 [Pseudomonadota bacterium]